ncbi:hypothetical protein HYFRA_00001030 [Hymenoscyphus fraxineus]|uniref:Alpha/beta hydrolase fold-3 domain-containing protein n=1 Tax=Hymenoscyphus fraxineus TaxID=746836 RepID=A0A9N9KVI3_9HELO|nr:hypothetical protein HYFRA_00001030 [Hymenoscyphus fraxineus]
MPTPHTNPPHTPSLLTHQPLKLLFTILTILTLPLRIIFILCYHIPKPLRQHPKWSYHTAIGVKIFTLYWRHTTTIEYHIPKTLNPGREKTRFVVITPPSLSPYRGITTINPLIRPLPIGGVWYNHPPPFNEPPKGVIIHFHGGAYVLGGAREMESGWGPTLLAQRTGLPVLQVQYRLSSDAATTFPAAVQDAITAYVYVLSTLKIRPENIVLSGDSAGGNLALALLRYLSFDGKDVLPLPRAVLLWSPWLDLRVGKEVIDGNANAGTEYLFGDLVVWGARRYTPVDLGSGHPYISPLGNEYPSEVPIFLQTGTAEVFYGDHVRFVDAMEKRGCEIEMVEVENAPHDVFAAGGIVGFVREVEDVVDRAERFMDGAVGKEYLG